MKKIKTNCPTVCALVWMYFVICLARKLSLEKFIYKILEWYYCISPFARPLKLGVYT